MPSMHPKPSSPRSGGFVMVVLVTALICIPVALLLWLLVPSLGQYGFVDVLTHSESIGLTVAALTVFARHLFRDVTGRLRWFLLPVLAVLSLMGFVLGTLLARWIIGTPMSPLGLFEGGEVGASLFVTCLVTVACTSIFVAREQMARLELAAAREGEKAETAKLAMLRAQIEPHMLFNTLANMRALIVSDPPRAVAMLDRFNDFLRETLNSSRRPWSTIDEEFKVLENYLELMKIRLGERLRYSLLLPAEIAPLEIPSLLLQPLVENAIRHGIEPSVQGGEIVVEAEAGRDEVIFTITDTGAGFDRSSKPEPAGGFGLSSVRERLGGSGHGKLSIESPVPGAVQGTRVVLRVPV